MKHKILNYLSVVYSTRQINVPYLDQIKSTIGIRNVDIVAIENNHKFSLTKAYNIGLERAKYNHIIFMHDDLKFLTQNWGRKMLNHFNRNPDYGIIGIAGTNNLLSGMWWEDRSSMHGIVNHGDHGKTWTNYYSEEQGNKLKPMITLDGLFFCIDKSKIIHKFDEMFDGYHLYDQDFTFSNFLAGVKLGVCTDIRVTHMSVGRTNDEWLANKKQFEEKYKHNLPCNLNGVW